MKRVNPLYVSVVLGFILLPVIAFRFLFPEANTPTPEPTSKPTVLGDSSSQNTRRIMLSNREGYTSGGVISLSSIEEPAIAITSWDIKTDVTVDLFEASETHLLTYLTHDKENQKIAKALSTDGLTKISSFPYSVKDFDEAKPLTLPLAETGIYLVTIKADGVNEQALIVRSPVGVVVKEGRDEYLFWAQEFKSKRSRASGTITVWNLVDKPKTLNTLSLNEQGIGTTTLDPDADIAIYQDGNIRSLIPINLRYLNSHWNYDEFTKRPLKQKFFVFTDRPLYQPGDTVYYKAVLRNDDDARYSIPSGTADISISAGWGDDQKVICTDKKAISGYGTVDGKCVIPKDSQTGQYELVVTTDGNRLLDWNSSNRTGFQVEEYRKPEYHLTFTPLFTEAIAGTPAKFEIKGEFFSGEPLKNATVEYEVEMSDYYAFDYYSDLQYYSDDYYGWYGQTKLEGGTVNLDENGKALLEINTKAVKENSILAVEISYQDESGNPVQERKNILVHQGEFDIYRKDYRYGFQVGKELVMPLILTSNLNSTISSPTLVVKTKMTEYYKKDSMWERRDEEFAPMTLKPDGNNETAIRFTPTKAGSYTFTVEGKDSRGNLISKTFYAYVTAENYFNYYEGQSNLTLTLDKPKYLPTDTMNLTVASEIPDRDVLITFDRDYVHKHLVVSVAGLQTSIPIELGNFFLPNMYVTGHSFTTDDLSMTFVNAKADTNVKKMKISLSTDKTVYEPGETVSLTLTTKDSNNQGISADVAVWAVDKSLFELVSQPPLNIHSSFWSERYNSTSESHSLRGIGVEMAEMGGGCFTGDAKVLTPKGEQAIKNLTKGDKVLTKSSVGSDRLVEAKITGVHKTTADGYLLVNNSLKVTPNHKVWINNRWQTAGILKIGDELLNSANIPVKVTSLTWHKENVEVFNLAVEKYHTFFANNVFVHNEKGGDRTVFKDAAYWNPSVQTDGNGQAQIRFTLPDNLTTWAIAAVGDTTDTIVGNEVTDIKVRKDIVIRPIIPNISREGDQIELAAFLYNYTENPSTFNVALEYPGATFQSAQTAMVTILANDSKRLYWKVKPEKANESAKVKFSALNQDKNGKSDSVTVPLPIRQFGFKETWSQAAVGGATIPLALTKGTDPKAAKFTLSLSPSLLGSLPTAMEYLLDYPYGCVEQTTSRFVPAVIAKANPSLFSEALANEDVDDYIEKGLKRLKDLQNSDGGWGWWYSNSNPFITTYVTEYVAKAKALGFDDQGMLKTVEGYFNQPKFTDRIDAIYKAYAQTYLYPEQKFPEIVELKGLPDDILALAVITNLRNGHSQANGLVQLKQQAKQLVSGTLSWQAAGYDRFGSADASTALAIRALSLDPSTRKDALSAIKFLTKNRKRNYWSNTFATAQTIQALVDYVKVGKEDTPNFIYSVSLGSKSIAKGNVTSISQTIRPITINPTELTEPKDLVITTTGTGELYSTFVATELITDRNQVAISKGLDVRREYFSANNPDKPLKNGDIIKVQITVNAPGGTEPYAVVVDQLPAGLVPVNKAFKNEEKETTYWNRWGYSEVSYSDDGATFATQNLTPGNNYFTYEARVISAGNFSAPPATAALMYAPDIKGHSGVGTFVIDGVFSLPAYREPIDSKYRQALYSPVIENIKNPSMPFMMVSLFTLFTAITVRLLLKWFHRHNELKDVKSAETENNSKIEDSDLPR